jgi:protein phosphatase
VRDLHAQQLPLCPTTTGRTQGTTGDGATLAPTQSPTPATTTGPGADTTGSAIPALPGGGILTTGAAPSTSTRPTPSSEPGVDCREEK